MDNSKKLIESCPFSREKNKLLGNGSLRPDDIQFLVHKLVANPCIGNLISGTGGLRKIRLRSASRGKRGSFRVCYYYFSKKKEIYLLGLFQKNQKENLTQEDKKSYKTIIREINR